jgi:hypothetical protein
MKKFNVAFISIILAVFSIAFISCDDEETSKDNSFKYDGKTYKIDEAYLGNFGGLEAKSTLSTYNLYLDFLTSGITYDTDNVEFSGTGSYFTFEMFTTSATELVAGTYTYDIYETLEPGTFSTYSEIGINCNFALENGTFLSIVAGTIKVKLSDTKYEITIDCTLENNKKLTGYYKGTLNYYVYVDDSKNSIEKRKR